MGEFSLSPRRLTLACVAIEAFRRGSSVHASGDRSTSPDPRLRLACPAGFKPRRPGRPFLVPMRVRQAISDRRADVHRHPMRMRDFVSFGRICSFRPVPSRNICSAAG